ncbi:MAG: co-chaperone GroES [Bacteroidetes bacterium]|nr:co-chaperone GroES [Bacteroidota bacterium]
MTIENAEFKVTPLSNRIIVEEIPKEKRSGLIYIPDSVQTPMSRGKIMAVGINCEEALIVGKEVMYETNSGSEFESDGKKYCLLRESNCVAVV